MAKYAIVNDATNAVENVVEWDGDTSIWQPPSGMTARAVDDNAETGGTWNGSAFVRKPVVNPTRTEVLMPEVKVTKKWDSDAGDMVNKTADEIAADKLELKNLLTNTLVGGTDLTWEQTQTLLRLERE